MNNLTANGLRILNSRDITIANLEQTLSEQQVLLVGKEDFLQAQSKTLAGLQHTLFEQQQIAQQKEKSLQSLTQSIANLEQTLSEQQREVSILRVKLEEKSSAFVELQFKLEETANELVAKEYVIRELDRAVNAFRAAEDFRSRNKSLKALKQRLIKKFRPGIGVLNQYSPRQREHLKPYFPKKSIEDWPRISLVTPSFNQGAFIDRTINSVLSQNYPNIEYLIQDGGSTDETKLILEKYQKDITYWEMTSDDGQSQAINRGFSKTCGEIMGWLNSDDLLLPDALTCIGDYFRRNPDVDVVYGNRIIIDENDMEIGRWILPGHDSAILSWADYVPQETLFWRRSLWERVGGKIDESFRFAMDWDLLIRFRDAGAKFSHIDRFLGAFRVHVEQKTSAQINDVGFLEMARLRERCLGRLPDPMEINAAIRSYLIKNVWVDFRHRLTRKVFF